MNPRPVCFSVHSRRLLVGILLGLVAHAGRAQTADLMTVVAQAVEHDAELSQARAGYEAAQQALPKARAALLPRIDGGWGRAFNRIASENSLTTSYWQNGWTVNLTQPLFDWSRWASYQQADFVAARGAVELAGARQALIVRAARAYFDVLAAEDERARATDYAAAIATHLEELRLRKTAGEATLIDLREADTLSEQALLQKMDARNDLALKYRAIEQLTGRRFSSLSRLSDAAVRPRVVPEDAEGWATQARAQGYPVQLGQIEWEIAKLDVSKVRGERYPVVNLTAGYTPAGAASGYARPTTTATAMVSVTVPLFTGGAAPARLKESLALEDQAEGKWRSASRQAEAEARENFSRFQWGVQRIDLLTGLVKTSAESLSAIQIGYKVGSRTSVDVLRAFDSLYASRRDLLRARYETLVALLRLKAATGALDTGEVAQINAQLKVGAPS